MFEVGDKVVHPTHGAGIISAIEEKEMVESFKFYYIIELTATQMKLMIPVDTAETIGLRPVARPAQIQVIYETLQGDPEELVDDFKQRQALLAEQLKSGNIIDVARVVRDLAWRHENHPLSPTESRQLDNAKQQLASELSLAEDRAVEESLAKIDTILQEAIRNKASSIQAVGGVYEGSGINLVG